MKTLLYTFFLTFASSPVWAHDYCLEVLQETSVFKHSDKEKIRISKGERFKPLKRNSKKTYYLIKTLEGYSWIKVRDVSLTKDLSCENSAEPASSPKPENKEKLVQTAPKVKRFQLRLGYAVMGDSSVGDGLLTSIADPNDVRKDPNPIFTDTAFNSSLSFSASYRWLLGPQSYFRAGLGYKQNSVEVEGFKNPDPDNSGAPLPLSSLSEPTSRTVDYSALEAKVEYGRRLWTGPSIALVGYVGANLEYRLKDSYQEEVFACGTESCPFKSSKAIVDASLDQMVFSPLLAVELEYQRLILGMEFSLYYLPVLNLGFQF